MKLEVLYFLQPSVNNGTHWTLLADSNTNMMRGLINEMILNDVGFTIVGPRFEDTTSENMRSLFPDWSDEAYEINSTQINYVEREGPVDANLFRYVWSSELDGIVRNWLNTDFDRCDDRVVWSNIPELTANIYQIIRPVKGSDHEDVKLINSCYFLDSPVHPKTRVDSDATHKNVNWWRQVEGAYRADIAGFCCDGNRFQFFEGIQTSHADHIVEEITKKSAVFRFGYSESELDNILAGKEAQAAVKKIRDFVGDRKLVVFPNRITDPDYTNGWKFLHACEKLDPEKFVFYATNPGEKYITHRELEQTYPNYLQLVHDTPSRAEYVAVLSEAHIHASLFVEEANGGCACREAMHLESLPVMPYANEYTRLTSPSYPGYITPQGTEVDITELARAITDMAEHTFEDFEFNHSVGSFRESAQEVIRVLAEHGIVVNQYGK